MTAFGDKATPCVHAGQEGTAGGPHVLLVPGAEVPSLALDLPGKLRGQAREDVARRQLRDRFGIEDAGEDTGTEMRPLRAGSGTDRFTRVLVADGARLDHWRSAAMEGCRAVLPDYLALPTAPGLWTLAATPDGVAVRLGVDDGFGGAAEVALALLDAMIIEGNTPRAMLDLGPDLPSLPGLADLAAAHDIPLVQDADALARLGIDAPRALAQDELAMDLRRDPRQARDAVARRWLPWRMPLALGLVAAGLWAASQVVIMQRIEAETAQIRANSIALVQEHFVPTGPVLDMRVQVSRALDARRSAATPDAPDTDPLALLNRMAGVIAAEGARTQEAGYTPNQGLTLVLDMNSFSDVDRLAAALRDTGASVDVLETRAARDGPGVRTDLRITAAENER
ncbi:hypothetical protein KUV51_21370 [Tateyamaria omphalii]|uniref:type II secretion system protein GspL n=1 Tax=Tateyamaria omphalii TaxID=299262 RepID=UPI001C990765|nr:type II secretion system protein GspL [Tateyamaria omphalii]MBY5935573.1 hypothetical protein [Tateyamaria omphalii]